MSLVAWFEVWVGVAHEEHVSMVEAAFDALAPEAREKLEEAGFRDFSADDVAAGYGIECLVRFDSGSGPEHLDVDELSKQIKVARKKASAALEELGLDLPVEVWSHPHVG